VNLITRRSTVAFGSAVIVGIRTASAQADDDRGPFGLTYGASTEAVQQGGVHLQPWPAKSDWGATFVASGLSKVLSDMESPVLSFGFKNKLWRIAAAGTTVGPDPYSNRIVARYQELAASLTQRYGPGKETDFREREIWKNPNEYIMSIKQGRASRYTEFDTPSAHVEISVRAMDDDHAFYLILFSSKSRAREFQIDKKEHEQNAF
jgi:hypothetical protein